MSMLFIGEHCSLAECNREDFLPIKCQHCSKSYCSNHYTPASHSCPSYGALQHDVRVPICPLCNATVKEWKRGEDPNIAMEAHILGECEVVRADGLVKESSDIGEKRTPSPKPSNICREKRCKNKMIAPIECPSCHLSFCPTHRLARSHDCSSLISASSPPTSLPSSNQVQRSGTGVTGGGRSIGTRNTPAALAAMRRAMASASASASASNSLPMAAAVKQDKGADSSGSPRPLRSNNLATHLSSLPLSKTERRAREERRSALKALKARHERGLLSEAEKVKLAEGLALEAKESERSGKGDCVVV